MSLIIKGMEMPENCIMCALRYKLLCPPLCHSIRARGHQAESGRLPDCPLVPLPEKHGRLGDLDALEDAFIRYYLGQERQNNLVFTPVEIKQHFADMIGDWPTIIPAEGGGESGN